MAFYLKASSSEFYVHIICVRSLEDFIFINSTLEGPLKFTVTNLLQTNYLNIRVKAPQLDV